MIEKCSLNSNLNLTLSGARESKVLIHAVSEVPEMFFLQTTNAMKGSRSTTNMQSKQGHSKKPRPEIRDDMDSRKSKEAGYKGDKSKKGDRKKAG